MRIAYQRIRAGARGPEMTITHHLDDATLMSFAAGALPAALAAVAAAHADMCPRCRREIAALERLGGAADGRAAAGRPWRAAPPMPPAPRAPCATRLAPAAAAGDAEIPTPLAGLLSGGLDAVAVAVAGTRRVGPPLCR